ncbi:hypothetical protein [Dactylosporangium darangshiense]|uniref:hypothetical protein n=1 Tax=Dactylosporangium darangshiense TaxID=579108 RepID=UPI0031F1BE7B
MYPFAIDLGTSNTVAVLRGADGQIRPLLFDGREQLPVSRLCRCGRRVDRRQ